jgi:hypothetical protein
MNKTLYYASRGFAILFIIMTALFALDIEKFSWTALLMHLLPTFVLLVILVISWLQERIGGILWILAAIAYIVIAWGDVHWSAYLLMSGPALVIGLLFLWPKSEGMHVPVAPMPEPGPVAPPSEEEPK